MRIHEEKASTSSRWSFRRSRARGRSPTQVQVWANTEGRAPLHSRILPLLHRLRRAESIPLFA